MYNFVVHSNEIPCRKGDVLGWTPSNIIQTQSYQNSYIKKQCNMVHIDLIGPYVKKIIQNWPGIDVSLWSISLTCTTKIYLETGWFKIIQVPDMDIKDNNWVTLNTQINHLSGQDIYSIKYGYLNTCIHEKLCLTNESKFKKILCTFTKVILHKYFL